jgi:hypothetical protein
MASPKLPFEFKSLGVAGETLVEKDLALYVTRSHVGVP